MAIVTCFFKHFSTSTVERPFCVVANGRGWIIRYTYSRCSKDGHHFVFILNVHEWLVETKLKLSFIWKGPNSDQFEHPLLCWRVSSQSSPTGCCTLVGIIWQWICLAWRGRCCSAPSKHVVCFKVQTPRPVLAGGSEACCCTHLEKIAIVMPT